MEKISRRQFLKTAAVAAIAAVVPLPAIQSAQPAASKWVVSSGLKEVINNNALKDIMKGGVIQLYAGSMPESPDDGSGELICTINIDDDSWKGQGMPVGKVGQFKLRENS